MASRTPRPRNGRCRRRAIPVPKADGEHDAEQGVPTRVLDAVPDLRVFEQGGEVAQPHEMVGGSEGSEWKKASMTVRTVG